MQDLKLLGIFAALVLIPWLLIKIFKKIPIRAESWVVIIIILFGILLYDSLFPDESFYQGEFQKISGLEFPQTAQFRFMESSFPDMHGDYVSCGIFVADQADQAQLIDYLVKQQKEAPEDWPESDCVTKLKQAYGSNFSITMQVWEASVVVAEGVMGERKEMDPTEKKGVFWQWGVLQDGKSFLFHYYRRLREH